MLGLRRSDVWMILAMAAAYAATSFVRGREWDMLLFGTVGIVGGATIAAICFRRLRRGAVSN